MPNQVKEQIKPTIILAGLCLFCFQLPVLAQSQAQVDKINKWFDQQKEKQKAQQDYWNKIKVGPIQTPGQIQKPGTIQKAGTIQAPTGWKAIKSSTLPCQQRYVICGDTLFEFDKSTLTPHAVSTLELLVPKLKEQWTHPVTIEGHTDAIGTDEYNQSLSTKRAEQVSNWLLEKKAINPDGVKVIGQGKRRPIAPNTKADGTDNPEGRQLNRRVEIVVNTCTAIKPKQTEPVADGAPSGSTGTGSATADGATSGSTPAAGSATADGAASGSTPGAGSATADGAGSTSSNNSR